MEIFRSHNDHFYDDVQLGLMYEMLPNDKKESYQTYDEWVISLCEMGERNSRLRGETASFTVAVSVPWVCLLYGLRRSETGEGMQWAGTTC